MEALAAACAFASGIAPITDDGDDDHKGNKVVHVVSLVEEWKWKRNVANESW